MGRTNRQRAGTVMDPREWLAGAAVGGVSVMICQSLGALIFAGKIPEAVPLGTASALVAAVVAGLVVAWRGSCAGVIASSQERIAPILALLTGLVVTRLPEGVPAAVKAATVMAALATTSLVVGGVLYLMGRLRLGNLTRYIPYPVVGGFLAGSGWLLMLGALRVMTGLAGGWSSVPRLVEPAILGRWLPGFVLGGLLFWLLRLRRKPLAFVAVLLAVLPLFYLALAGAGMTVEGARTAGWLPAVAGRETAVAGLWGGGWRQVRWDVLPGITGIVGSVLVTSALSILLNASGVELLTRREADLNGELRAAGLANLVSAAAGGMVGFQSLNLTRLGFDMGSRGRGAAVVAAGVCLVALGAGPGPASYVPRLMLGAVLCQLGLGFLHDWVVRARKRLPQADYVVVLLILGAIGTLGYVQGVVVGVLAAVILFVHNYSRVSVVTHTLSAADHPSNVDRPPEHRRLLAERGAQVLVLRLQGFIFFGTANSVLQQIRARAELAGSQPLRFVVLDFHRVSGLDSSAAFSLSRALQVAEKHGFQLILTHLSPEIRRQLREEVFRAEIGEAHRLLPTLDHGMEWCEEQLLAEGSAADPQEVQSLREQLAPYWSAGRDLDAFLGHLDRLELPAGARLIRQGEPADALYFVESGQVTTALETASGARRLRRQGPGTVLGELGLFLGLPRTASVMADTACVVYRLAATDLERMQRESPEWAARFYAFMSRHLAERVVNCNRIIKAFME